MGVVALRNSRHCGALGYYAHQAAKADMVGLAMTNAGAWVVPTNAKRRMLGTNPIAIAAPSAEGPPFLADITSSTIAMGKVETATRLKQPLLEGWALDGQGRTTTDPAVVYREGGLTPLGSTTALSSYKGYGLAMVVDIFAGLLSGTPWSFRLNDPGSQAGQFFMAFEIEAFADPRDFLDAVGEMLMTLRSAEPVDGTGRVLVPGSRCAPTVKRTACPCISSSSSGSISSPTTRASNISVGRRTARGVKQIWKPPRVSTGTIRSTAGLTHQAAAAHPARPGSTGDGTRR